MSTHFFHKLFVQACAFTASHNAKFAVHSLRTPATAHCSYARQANMSAACLRWSAELYSLLQAVTLSAARMNCYGLLANKQASRLAFGRNVVVNKVHLLIGDLHINSICLVF